MNVTEHVLKRYCERILRIPPADIDKYLSCNRPLVTKEVHELIEKSTLLYRGQINPNSRPVSYYVYQDIMIICSFEGKVAFTLYQINLPYSYSSTVDKRVIRAIVREAIRCQAKFTKAQKAAEIRLEAQKNKQAVLDKQSHNLRNRLNQIEEKKKQLRKRIWEVKSKPEDLEKEIKNLVSQLIIPGGDDIKKAKKSS